MNHTINNSYKRAHPGAISRCKAHPSHFSIVVTFTLLLSITLVAGCGFETSPATKPEPEPIIITEVDLEDLLSRGLPVILNFGDNSEESLETLATLKNLNDTYFEKILIRSVDLVQNPNAREGFPVPNLPTQLYYTSEGKPIPLPVNYGNFMSSLIPMNSTEAVFTLHEGLLDEESVQLVIKIMGLE